MGSGPGETFEVLWRATHERVWRYVYCRCGNGADADELVQECYTRVWQSWGQYEGRSSRTGWLFGIVWRTVLSHGRAQRLRRTVSLERVEAEPVAAGDEVGQRESLEAVWEVICGLEEVHREVMWLRFGAALSYREMAEALGIAEGTVRSRLWRGLKALREKMRVNDDG